MAIMKMKFISIVGRIDYFEEFALKYIINSGIEPVDALIKLENVKGLSHYPAEEPYSDLIKKIASLAEFMGIKKIETEDIELPVDLNYDAKQLKDEISLIENEIRSFNEAKEKYEDDIKQYYHIQKNFELLKDLNIDLNSFFNFEFIKFRFGKMPKRSYRQLQLYVDELNAIVYPVSQDEDFVWLMYFTPRVYHEKVDSIFSSLYFERVRLPAEFTGTPKEVLNQIKEKLDIIHNEQNVLEKKIKMFSQASKETIIKLYKETIRNKKICRMY